MHESMEAATSAKAINAERLRAWSEGKALLDDVVKRGGTFSAEEQAKWDRINTHINDLDAERDAFLARERRERESAVIREAEMRDFGGSRPGSPNDDRLLRSFLDP